MIRFALIFLAFLASGCAFDLSSLHGTGLAMVDSGPNFGDSGPNLGDGGPGIPDAGTDAFVVPVPDAGTDARGPTGLDPQYPLPPTSEPTCSLAGVPVHCGSDYDHFCRPYDSSDTGRCDPVTHGLVFLDGGGIETVCPGSQHCACSTSSECDSGDVCFNGQCRNLCVLGTSACGSPVHCIPFGNSSVGWCDL